MAKDDDDTVVEEFKDNVNMTASVLDKWLDTDESKAVGQKDSEGGESVGHEMGRTIVQLLHKKKADYTDEDIAHMRKVNGYVKRHMAQRPAGDVEETPWRYSLMNWGHDPLKKES